jgi:hypothetical protein
MHLVHGILSRTQRQHGYAKIACPAEDIPQPLLAHLENAAPHPGVAGIERNLKFAVRDGHLSRGRKLALQGIVHDYGDDVVMYGHRRNGLAGGCVGSIARSPPHGPMNQRRPEYRRWIWGRLLQAPGPTY